MEKTLEKKEAKSLFAPAANKQAYIKGGIYGPAGSGKTFTAATIALGTVALTKIKAPVYMVDTENGSDYLKNRFDAAGVELRVAKTRSFLDLMAATQEAVSSGSFLIVDSITHIWNEVQEAYRVEKRRDRLQFQDWGPIKASWQKFTDLYLNAPQHIIVCGRAGDVYEYFLDDDGKKQLEKTGTKMQAEKNLGYEPSLLLEMVRVNIGEFKKDQRNQANRCLVIKDRFDKLDGKFFDNPKFEVFLPHIELLNLGGEHKGIDTSRNSNEMFAKKDHELNVSEVYRQKEIVIEEIQGEFTSKVPGQSAEEKKLRADLLQEVFMTRSYEAMKDLDLGKLKLGLATLRARLQAINTAKKDAPVNGGK